MIKSIVIIPAYNEDQNIETVVESIKKYANDFDYVIINDHSNDETEKICIEKGYHCISLPINLGIGGAVQTGYIYAAKNAYDIAVQFDGDGQHNAEFLSEMRDRLLKESADMIIGSRFLQSEGFKSSLLRRIGIKWFNSLIHVKTGQRITDPTSGMRMVNRRVIEHFAKEYPTDYPEPESVVKLLKNKYKVIEIPVIMNKRTNGKSSISPMKAVYYMIKVSIAIILS